jgi:anti-anti-sigma factor
VQDVVSEDRHRLIPSGDLDSATAGELEAVILRTCGDGRAVMLDLSRLTSMDSGGLQLILLARSLCRECGSEFSVIPGEQNIDHLLEISGSLERIPLRALESRQRQAADTRAARSAALVSRGEVYLAGGSTSLAGSWTTTGPSSNS